MIITRKKFDSFLFILSPFLSLPNLLIGIYNKRINSFYLLAILFGIISYLFIPTISNDKATYYTLYDEFMNFSLEEFQEYLSLNTDVIFYFLIYLFTSLGISVDYLFFFSTFFTVFTFFRFFLDIVNKDVLKKNIFFIMASVVIFSISLPNLFSGVRFYLAIAFVLWSYDFFFIKNKSIFGVLFLLLALQTHFSCLLYVPIFIMLYINKYNNLYGLFKVLYFISFLMMLIPTDYITSKFALLNMSDSFKEKGDAYVSIEGNLASILDKGNVNNMLLYFISNAWIYLGYFYIIISIRRFNKFRPFVLLLITFCNFFFAFPVIFNRYLLLISILFVIMICYEYTLKQASITWLRIFLVVFGLSFFSNGFTMWSQISHSVFTGESISTLTLLFKENITKDKFIKTGEEE